MRSGLVIVVGLIFATDCFGGEVRTPSASRGYELLRTHQYLPPDFDDDVFAALWTTWPEPDRSEAEQADPATRRKLTFSYYGLISDPEDADGTKPALGYVADGKGNWVMNCLACHGGKVAGRVIPGLPNSHTALQTLTEDVRMMKLVQGKKLSHLDLAILKLPLNTTNGTTNAVVFGIVLGTYRNPDMSVDLSRSLPPLVHHDVDAPPFWNVRKKRSLYTDGHAPKTPRPLMQFILLPRVPLETLTKWEPDFADILAWIESLEPPKYPFEINRDLAARGEAVFKENCARCHGTYGPNGKYEQQTIALDEIGTDPVRLKSLTPRHRQWMKEGWVSRFGDDPVEVDPAGYVAPPLDGIWASAPYFHNGSVPTLWHVLHPNARPVVWKRTEDGYDRGKVGLEVETFDKLPASVKFPSHRRRYFDTKLPGKSAAGHTFPNVLDEDEKRELLEYLKTL
jgi:mono/diheme cytochrome c family protein